MLKLCKLKKSVYWIKPNILNEYMDFWNSKYADTIKLKYIFSVIEPIDQNIDSIHLIHLNLCLQINLIGIWVYH